MLCAPHQVRHIWQWVVSEDYIGYSTTSPPPHANPNTSHCKMDGQNCYSSRRKTNWAVHSTKCRIPNSTHLAKQNECHEARKMDREMKNSGVGSHAALGGQVQLMLWRGEEWGERDVLWWTVTWGVSACCICAIDSANRLQVSSLYCYMLTHAFWEQKITTK